MTTKRELTHAEKFLHGLLICSQYQEFDCVCAEHDIIYAGPDPEDMSEHDRAIMLELGWHETDEDCWGFFT